MSRLLPVSTSSCRTLLALSALAVGLSPQAATGAANDEVWPVIGRQGIVRLVLVPAGAPTQQAAYEAQIARLCEPERTCFLNFYTNSTGAALEIPLPDAIANEATATYRQSMKNGVQTFVWSCRLKLVGRECF